VDRLTVTADTNVYISALQFDGRPDQLLRLARQGLVRLAVSEAILAEVRRVLGDKFRRAPEEVAEADRLIRGFAELVAPTRRLAVVAADPDDDRILECAVAAGAQVIVSGDKDLLHRGRFEGIEIVTVAAFLERYFPAPPGQARTGSQLRPRNARAHPRDSILRADSIAGGRRVTARIVRGRRPSASQSTLSHWSAPHTDGVPSGQRKLRLTWDVSHGEWFR
jgi:putative PIN family toxin of toxin-antitoxin system